MRTVVIDDEQHVREVLANMLDKYCPQLELVGEANSVESGIKLVHEVKPDLLLLDIQLGDGTGFDLLRAVEYLNVKVVFVTAYEQYAIQAFKFAAVGFILKPINHEELSEVMGRVESLENKDFSSQLEVLEDNLQADIRQNRKIILKTLENIYLVKLQDIICCESDRSYTIFRTTQHEKILISKPMKEFELILEDHGFLRIHRSHIINLSHIRRFEKKEGGYMVLTDDIKVPVASRKREEMLAVLEKMTH
jgi:two-component system LytT family response regulator